MDKKTATHQLINPIETLLEITKAIPEECRKNLTLIGSLAAGVCYNDLLTGVGIRTKDADCLISPRIDAITAGTKITEQLIESGWKLKADGDWSWTGNLATPDGDLPAVRLFPPGGGAWFIELLTVPETPYDRERKWARIETTAGHFGLPSFGFISIAGFEPKLLTSGVSIAYPEMMSLANMLEHPMIRPETMSAPIAGREIKRSNKDLGRVLAIAHLATIRDEDALLGWPEKWLRGLNTLLPEDIIKEKTNFGSGIRQLLGKRNEQDLDEALHTCVYGLLAKFPLTLDQLRVAGERLLIDAVEPVERELKQEQ